MTALCDTTGLDWQPEPTRHTSEFTKNGTTFHVVKRLECGRGCTCGWLHYRTAEEEWTVDGEPATLAETKARYRALDPEVVQ